MEYCEEISYAGNSTCICKGNDWQDIRRFKHCLCVSHMPDQKRLCRRFWVPNKVVKLEISLKDNCLYYMAWLPLMLVVWCISLSPMCRYYFESCTWITFLIFTEAIGIQSYYHSHFTMHWKVTWQLQVPNTGKKQSLNNHLLYLV